MTDEREIIWRCEGCGRPIFDGDRYHAGADVELCEQCAPTYEDLLSSPGHFRNTERDEAMTVAEAKAFCDAHVEAGGSLTDKLLTTA